jgi:rhodanese-related sulfurtransferase
MMIGRIVSSTNLKMVVFVAIATLLALGGASLFLFKETNRDGLYNLGGLSLGEEIIHEFLVLNPFPTELAIAAVRSAHGDAQVLSYETRIPPRGQGVLRVSVRPTRVGPLVAKFHIDYKGERHGLRQMGLRGDVAPPDLPRRSNPGPSLVVSAPELLGLLAGEDDSTPIVVDLRGPEDFQRLHIPKSLNMTSSQLKASRHLTKRPLVLVDEGQVSPSTLQTAAQLEAIGFSRPRVLDGGVASWQALGAPVAGSDNGLPVQISPPASLEAAAGGWTVVDLQTSASALPQSVAAIRLSASQVGDDAELRKLRESLPENARLVVLTDAGLEREALRGLAPALEGVPVAFVRGGAAALNREYLRMAAASAQPASARINGTASVSTRRVSRSVGGCSSCP